MASSDTSRSFCRPGAQKRLGWAVLARAVSCGQGGEHLEVSTLVSCVCAGKSSGPEETGPPECTLHLSVVSLHMAFLARWLRRSRTPYTAVKAPKAGVLRESARWEPGHFLGFPESCHYLGYILMVGAVTKADRG